MNIATEHMRPFRTWRFVCLIRSKPGVLFSYVAFCSGFTGLRLLWSIRFGMNDKEHIRPTLLALCFEYANTMAVYKYTGTSLICIRMKLCVDARPLLVIRARLSSPLCVYLRSNLYSNGPFINVVCTLLYVVSA